MKAVLYTLLTAFVIWLVSLSIGDLLRPSYPPAPEYKGDESAPIGWYGNGSNGDQ